MRTHSTTTEEEVDAPVPAAELWSRRGLLSVPGTDAVRVFDHEPDLLAGLDAGTAEVVRRRAVAPKLWLDPGPWLQPGGEAGRFRDCLGLLVLDGLVIRSVRLNGRDCPELIGSGDLLRPWDQSGELSSLAHATSWKVLEPTTLAALDARFAALVCRWPSVVGGLLSRSVQRSRALAVHLAIAHARQADTRLLLLFWHLADRWGRVAPEGVVVPLRLTHELLAHLVCLRRPTASTALQQLAQSGEVVRRRDGSWLLTGAPPTGQAAVSPAPTSCVGQEATPDRREGLPAGRPAGRRKGTAGARLRTGVGQLAPAR